MAKEIDLSSFEANTVSASASPVNDTLQAQVHTQCNAQVESASSKEGYSIDEVAQILGIARRTAFKYASEILEVWFWLDEAEFRKTGTYTEFALTELKSRKTFARLDDYRQAVQEANRDRIQQPIEVEIEDDLGLDCGILARYEKKPQEDQQSSQVVPYFNPTDYQSRYTSSEQRLKNQQQKEIGFANELLTKFADFAEDDAAWKQSEAQNSEARQREMAIAGMSEALGDFLQKNTAYRSMMERLEAGEITPEQVMEFLKRMQSPKSPVGNGSSASS
jgi:predicted transcriptional regulator YheO